MATITSTTAGEWSAGATWVGGIAPGDGDKAVINHTVTVGGTYVVGVDGATDSILIGAAGTLKASRIASSSLTVRGVIKHNAAGAVIDYGTVGDEIPAAYTATLILNRAGTAGLEAIQQNGNLTSFGFYCAGETSRNRITTLTSAITATGSQTFTVDDATGWLVNDYICLAHSDATNPATTKYERVQITGISGNSVTATVAYIHAVGCYVGNMYSNVEIKSYNALPAWITLNMVSLTAASVEIRNTLFTNVGRSSNGQAGVRLVDGKTGTNVTTPVTSFYGNIFNNDASGYATPCQLGFSSANRVITVDSCIFYGTTTVTSSAVGFELDEQPNFTNCLACCTNLTASPISRWIGGTWAGGMVSINNSGYVLASNLSTPNVTFSDMILSGCGNAIGNTSNATGTNFENCDFGLTHGWNPENDDRFYRLGGISNRVLSFSDTGSVFAASINTPTDTTTWASMSPTSVCSYTNKTGDVTIQERYSAYGTAIRSNAIRKNSTSCVALQPTVATKEVVYEISVPVAANGSITIAGNIKYDTLFYNSGTWTAPTVTISGLGITPEVFTATATAPKSCSFNISTSVVTETGHGRANGSKVSFATTGTFPTGITTLTSPTANTKLSIEYYVKYIDANTYTVATSYDGSNVSITGTAGTGHTALTWQGYTLTATNNVGSPVDGNFTVTFSATAASAITGTVFFDGVPTASPYVTKARTYGYQFDQTATQVTANAATSANEATANAYTKFSVSGTATASDVALLADATFQQLYDYTQAWSCRTENQTYAIPTTSPVSGVLIAASDVVTTGYTLNGSGSLAMGAKTLTADTPFDYTYTGGTFSQAATGPAFAGGTLTIPTAITTGGNFSMTGATIEFGAASALWDLGDVTFSGTITLATTAGQAVTVAMPTGTTINNTEPGNITVTVPVVTADISITSMPNAGAVPTRLQIINSTALSASAWAANTVYATGALVKRSTGIGSESTAGLYFRATTGGTSHATTEPTWDTTVGNTTADGTVVWTCYAVLYYDADPAATSLTDTYIDGEEFLDGEVAEIRFAEMNGSTSFKTYSTTAVVNSAGFSVLVSEDADDVYATNALDGSDYEATFSPNFTLDYMVLDTNTDFAGKAAFAYYCYTLTTSAGMWGFWGGVTALDEGNYRVNTAILNLYFDESAGFVKQTDNVRIFRDDGLRPAIDPTTGGHGIEINWRTPVSTIAVGSAVLPGDITDIIDGVWSRVLPL